MPLYKLFSTARSYVLLEYDHKNFTPHGNIFYRYNFTHASPILCSKSLHLHLYFLGSHLYIYKWFYIFYFLFSGLSSVIEYNIFHKHTLCQQHEAISHYHISLYKFYLTFRNYCGINLLLRHQYGSHYLYLNLKNLILRSSSDSASETGSATMISSFAWLKETASLTKLYSSTAFLILFPQGLQTLSDKFLLRTNLNPMDSHASARIKSNRGFLVCVMVWIYFQMIRSFLPQTSDFGCRTYSCRQRLPFFAPRFFNLFSEFQSQTLINIISELSHSNSKQTSQACNYREELKLTPDWLFLTVVYCLSLIVGGNENRYAFTAGVSSPFPPSPACFPPAPLPPPLIKRRQRRLILISNITSVILKCWLFLCYNSKYLQKKGK
jgi:hypothetical protein